jgi:hypothetical protein
MRTPPKPAHVVGFFIGLAISWACIDAGMRAPSAPPVACTPTPALAQN